MRIEAHELVQVPIAHEVDRVIYPAAQHPHAVTTAEETLEGLFSHNDGIQGGFSKAEWNIHHT